MAIIIKCSNPNQLFNDFQQKVLNLEIVTWQVDEDKDFTIRNEKWAFKAWMRPIPQNGKLIFGYVSSVNYKVTKGLYGVFHGRLVATLLAHFDDDIESIEIKPQLDPEYDKF